ncbi:MAG: hypothetical protein AMXMBFR77_19630 [Phycisphaerales bacterium]|nr:MAG: hypothetical protein EDM76_13630 [bacterium]GIK19629.1 MAG: hypothetical protein BroJett004_17930 [Planctomycetota bacterium]
MLIVLRCTTLLAMPVAVVPFASWIQEGVRDGDLLDVGYYWPRVTAGFLPFVYFVFVLMFGRLFVHFVVPLRRWSECPACRYRLEGLVEARCPECGLALSPEFMGLSPERDSNLRRTARVIRTREIVAVVLRFCGVLAGFAASLSIAGAVVALGWVTQVGDEYTGWYISSFVAYLVFAGVTGGITVVLLFMPMTLARFIVPGPPRPAAPQDRAGGENRLGDA